MAAQALAFRHYKRLQMRKCEVLVDANRFLLQTLSFLGSELRVTYRPLAHVTAYHLEITDCAVTVPKGITLRTGTEAE